MSNFCIMRIKKLHTNANVGGALSHHLRTRQTDNADPKKMELNWFYPNQSAPQEKFGDIDFRRKLQNQSMAMYKKNLPKKIRKNGVRAVEFMMTVSPEVMQRKDFNVTKYLNSCANWVREKFGKENVFFIAYHEDETTPHVSILMTPIDEKGKLNARSFFGGREKMSALQDDFYEKVGKQFNLERGLKGSKAKHQTMKKYYEKLNQAEEQISSTLNDLSKRIPDKKLLQSSEEYKADVLYAVKNELETVRPLINKGLGESRAEARIEAVESEKKQLEEELDQAEIRHKKEVEEEKKQSEKKLYDTLFNDRVKIGTTKGDKIMCENGVGTELEKTLDKQKTLEKQLNEFKNMTPEQFQKYYQQQQRRRQRDNDYGYSR